MEVEPIGSGNVPRKLAWSAINSRGRNWTRPLRVEHSV
jgi:hypothetical protein